MKKNNSSKIQGPGSLFRLVFYVFSFFIIAIFGICFFYLTTHTEVITIVFTNIGFAVFLTFANTCFSWARSFAPEKYSNIISRINRISYFSIICALTFMLSSVAQFLISIGKPTISQHAIFGGFFWVLGALRMLLVFSVLSLSFGIIFEVFAVIKKLMFSEYIDLKLKEHAHTDTAV